MKKEKSLNVIGTAIAVSILTLGVICWAEKSLTTPNPLAQQTASKNAETEAVIKETTDSLMAVVQKHENSRKTNYNGMANWFGDDIISGAIEDVSARVMRKLSEFKEEEALGARLRQAAQYRVINGDHT